jgi:hypothetical protein
MTKLRATGSVLFAVLVIGACDGVVENTDPDSETHWLARCSADSDCDPSALCACGLCTVVCDGADACGAAIPADCVARENLSTCDSTGGSVCVATCETEGCPGGTRCAGGLCVPSSGSAPFTVENPTGTCEATGDGSRPGYHSPDAGDVYLPDCKLELDREYWRVFATAPDSAYTIPRTDGNPMLRLACTTPGQPESPLVEKYGLCQPASSAAAVDRVNDLLIEDAFAITRYLHSQLVFRGVDTGVAPPPLPDDVIDACALHPESSSVALQTVCEEERARMMSGNDIGISYGEVGL